MPGPTADPAKNPKTPPMQLRVRGDVFTDFDFAHLLNGIEISTTLPSNNAIALASSCA